MIGQTRREVLCELGVLVRRGSYGKLHIVRHRSSTTFKTVSRPPPFRQWSKDFLCLHFCTADAHIPGFVLRNWGGILFYSNPSFLSMDDLIQPIERTGRVECRRPRCGNGKQRAAKKLEINESRRKQNQKQGVPNTRKKYGTRYVRYLQR
jgi:hypothetical protein